MAIETAKEQICINQIVGQNKEVVTVEGDVIVNDVKPDVLNIISTNGTVCIRKKEVMDGKVKIEGCIDTYIIYLADDEAGSIRSLNTSLDFIQTLNIDNCRQGMTIDENVCTRSMESKILNGRKINVKAFLEIDIRLYSNDDFEVINNINDMADLQVLNTKQNVISKIGEGCNKVYAKDTISIDEIDDLAEIMRVDFKICNEETKISYNKILSKADAKVEIMYLTEDNRINTVSATIPVMGFADIANVNDECICNARNKLKNIVIKPNYTEEHSIYVEAELELSCQAYEVKELDIIEDLYGLTNDVSYTQKNVRAMTGRENITDTCNVRQRINIPEMQNGKVYSICVNPVINNTDVRNNKVIYEGDINLNILYDNNGVMNSENKVIPFNFEISSDSIEKDSVLGTDITVDQDNFMIMSGGEIEVNINLIFNVTAEKNKSLRVIDEINIDENRQRDIYSMVIYFVKPGDTLWKIAKAFKSRVEDIARVNNIENPNVIHPGQQLYIPKFTKNMAAI